MNKGKTTTLKTNYTGYKIGLLTITSYSHTKKYGSAIKSIRTYWNYHCECGCVGIIDSFRLSSNNAFSCGCQRGRKGKPRKGNKNIVVKKYKRKTRSGTRMQDIRYSYKRRANKKGIVFDLSSEVFWNKSNSNCYYCNQPPSQLVSKNTTTKNKWSASKDWYRSGLDRIDSAKGYTDENTVACCDTCNYMKRELTQQQFISYIQTIFKQY